MKAKETLNTLGQKIRRVICALGGRIEGVTLQKDEGAMIRHRVAQVVFSLVFSFLLAGTEGAFGSYPFAIALLCSAGHSSALPVFIGSLAGALSLGSSALPHLLIYLLALICRVFLSPRTDVEGRRVFEESVRLRILICLSLSFLLGICTFAFTLNEGGLEGVFAMIFTTVCAPLLCVLFCSARRGSSLSSLRFAGMSALLFTGIYCLYNNPFFGRSFALSLSFLIILALSGREGALKGSMCGLICALATGMNPLPFVLAGFASGAFRAFGTVPAVFACLGACLGSALYLEGIGALFSPGADIIFACLIYLPLTKTELISKLFPASQEGSEQSSAVRDATLQARERQSERRRFDALSKAFDELSEVFVKLSQKLRSPGAFEIRNLCEEVFDTYCKRCSLVAYCRHRYYEESTESISQIAEQVRNKGYIELSDVPEFLLKRCRHIEKIIGSINSARADMVESAVKKDKTELFALDYEAIAGLLRDSAENDGEYTLDSALQNKVSKILRSLGIRSMAYGAWGVRRHTLLASGVELGSIAVSSEEIRTALEKGTGLSLGTPEFNFSGEFVSMTLESRPLFSLQWEHSCYCAEGEEVSGDRCSCFNGVGDYSYACICDGMGSGAGASAVSEICSMFFEKMLGAGNSIPVTLKLLSNFLRARSEEYHCTADIFRLDTLSGKGCFIKCGSCASYVIRNTNIFKIDARSMPLGLTKEINAEKIEIPLLEGDTVVMVSDGVAPDLESALWLPSLLTECAGLPLKELTRLIAGRAKAENSLSDDISVLALKISSLDESSEKQP